MPETHDLTIFQVLPSLDFGGVEKGTLEIARKLVDTGYRSVVISSGGSMVEQLCDEGSEHIKLPVGNKSLLSLRFIPGLRKIFHTPGRSIVHARSRFPAWLCLFAIKGMEMSRRPRFVTTVHGVYSVNKYSAVMMKGERVIAISEYVRDYIKVNYPDTDLHRVKLIPRGVDLSYHRYGYKADSEWQRTWFEQFPQTRNKKLVTLPARITRWKGHEDFLEIFRNFAPGANIHGLIVGGCSNNKRRYLDRLKHNTRRLGISDYISFTGHRNDVREIFSISDIVLSLSGDPEAFGRTSLEALSLGVPVIAYDHGGASEILKDIFPDGLVPVKNPARVADKIGAYVESPPRVNGQNKYTLEIMQNQTIAVYDALFQPQKTEL